MPRDPRKPRPQTESSKVFIPETLDQLLGSSYSKFLIAFTKESPGCINFKTWLQNNQNKISFPIYKVNSTSDPALTASLYKMCNIQGFPALVVTDKSLKLIDVLIGFNEKAAVSFFKKNFSDEAIELH